MEMEDLLETSHILNLPTAEVIGKKISSTISKNKKTTNQPTKM